APFRPMRPGAGGRFKIFLFGGIGSVLLALLALAAAASLDDRLYGARDVQGLVGDGIVVLIPRLTSRQGGACYRCARHGVWTAARFAASGRTRLWRRRSRVD